MDVVQWIATQWQRCLTGPDRHDSWTAVLADQSDGAGAQSGGHAPDHCGS